MFVRAAQYNEYNEYGWKTSNEITINQWENNDQAKNNDTKQIK